MKPYLPILLAALALCACGPTETTQETPSLTAAMVESHGIVDFYCNRKHQTELAQTGWDYVSGLVANAVLRAWELYPDSTAWYDAVKAFADRSTSPDGTQVLNSKGETALRPSNIDDLPAGNIYFTLAREEARKGNDADAQRYRTAATVIRNKLKYDHSRIAEGLPGAGGFFHKAQYPNQMWLDGLFMGSPIYAAWEHHFGGAQAGETPEEQAASWADIAHQFKTINQMTYDADRQLNYHAWSATPDDANSFWAQKDGPHRGCSQEFWARGMGWFFAALADVLEYMPQDHPDYADVRAIINQVAAGLARWQDQESGVWYQLLQYDASKTADGVGDTIDGQTYNVGTQPNYLEASASSIFTYAYLKAIRLGLIDRETYLPVAEKAYQGLIKTFIRPNAETGKTDIIQVCASAGLGPAKDPSRTGTANYYLAGKDVTVVENEGKAIGSFIMASVEYDRLKAMP